MDGLYLVPKGNDGWLRERWMALITAGLGLTVWSLALGFLPKSHNYQRREALKKLLEQENNEISEAKKEILQSKIRIIEQENTNFRAINQNLNEKIVKLQAENHNIRQCKK